MTHFYKVLAAMLFSLAIVGCSSNSTVDDDVDTDIESKIGVEPEPVDVGTVDTTDTLDVTDTYESVDTVFYFEFDSAILSSQARSALMQHAERLNSNPRSVRLEGHADERGSREYNMALGERRANAVRDFLVLQGVASNLLETVSYGEERPAVVGSSSSAWSQNRRVEMN